MADFSIDSGALQNQAVVYRNAITLASAERSRADNHMKNILNALTNMNKSHVKTISDLTLLAQEAAVSVERLGSMIAKNVLLLAGQTSRANSASASGDLATFSDAVNDANMYSEWIATEHEQLEIAQAVEARAKTEIAKTKVQLAQQMIASNEIGKFNETATMHTSAVFRGGILAEKLNAFALAVVGKDSNAAAALENELLANMPDKDYWNTEEGKKFNEFFVDPATASMRATGAAAQHEKEFEMWNAVHPGANDIEGASATAAAAKLEGQISDVYGREPTAADPWNQTMTDFIDTSEKARANSKWWNHYGPWIQGAAMAPAVITGVVGGGILAAGALGVGAAGSGAAGAGVAGAGAAEAGGAGAAVAAADTALVTEVLGGSIATEIATAEVVVAEATVVVEGASTVAGAADGIAAAQGAINQAEVALKAAQIGGNAAEISKAQSAVEAAWSLWDKANALLAAL